MAGFLASLAFVVPCSYWVTTVIDSISSPYLDEVFHARQAQHYCRGHYEIWDPKITTPPGLYILSSYLSKIWPFSNYGCELSGLRLHSAFFMMAIWVLLGLLDRSRSQRRGPDGTTLVADVFTHSRSNIALFPPLFFFSALFYTDGASTLGVLAFHYYFVSSHQSKVPTWRRTPTLILLGIICLSFRQTNIFWVAVFPAAVALVYEIDNGPKVAKSSMHQAAEGFGNNWANIAKTSWRMRVVFNPPICDASLEDYGKTVVSFTACLLSSLTDPQRLISIFDSLTPFIVLISCFVGFVAWNGSVVLGDKSNHVATLHLPQMLYIWPYMVFFSWPLVFNPLMVAIVTKTSTMMGFTPTMLLRQHYALPRIWLLVSVTILSMVVVNLNTIVHPFTLADNRHYTFYVFRILTRPWWFKYLVTPVYVMCGWACVQALGETFTEPANTVSREEEAAKNAARSAKLLPKDLPLPNGTDPATTLFVLIWLGSTSLQLITAPLVEPRYFILPWVFWRIHIPIRQEGFSSGSARSRKIQYDKRLYGETLWLLVVNAVTGYIFLNWEFEWRQEPGKVQRFMW